MHPSIFLRALTKPHSIPINTSARSYSRYLPSTHLNSSKSLTTITFQFSTNHHSQILKLQQRSKFHKSLTNQNRINNQSNSRHFSSTSTSTTHTPLSTSHSTIPTSSSTTTTKTVTESIIPPSAHPSGTSIPSSSLPPTLPTTFPRFSSFTEFIEWYLVDPPKYLKYSTGWWLSNTWLMLMYSVTGYSALRIVRKVLSLSGIDNVGLFQGEPQHRFIYFLLMTPTYSLLTLANGYAFGRPVYCAQMVRRIWGRFFPWLKKQKTN